MSIIIRVSAEEDAEAIAGIESEAFSMPWSVNAFTDAIKSKNYIYLTAFNDNEIVGYAGCTVVGDEGDITNIAVDKNYSKRGIGEMLIRRLIEEADDCGIGQIFLEVRASNIAAQALYTKVGFEMIGTRRNFYQKPTEDACLMKWTKI